MLTIKTPSKADALAFPITGDVVSAGRFFGLGRDATYRAIKDGTFPTPVLKIGGRYRVTRASLLAALGVEDETATVGFHSGNLTSENAVEDGLEGGS